MLDSNRRTGWLDNWCTPHPKKLNSSGPITSCANASVTGTGGPVVIPADGSRTWLDRFADGAEAIML